MTFSGHDDSTINIALGLLLLLFILVFEPQQHYTIPVADPQGGVDRPLDWGHFFKCPKNFIARP